MNENYAKLRQEQLPWTDRFKPMTVNELYLDPILKNRILDFAETKSMPNLILCGPPGVGKTATVKCLARALYGKYASKGMLEMNASDGGVKVLHEEIVTFCRNRMSYSKVDPKTNPEVYANFKLIIIDASDNMDENKVQPQISNIMETYKNTVRFAFTCNTSSNIIESIQSRCLMLNCGLANISAICGKLKDVCKKEQINYDSNALKQIAELSRGDIRSAINMLQLVKNKKEDIKLEYVNELCDLPQQVVIKKLFNTIQKKNMKSAILVARELKQYGYSGSDITLGMIHTLKSDTCNDIPEKDKIEMFKQISHAIYRISKHTDSTLQLYSCIADMINGNDGV